MPVSESRNDGSAGGGMTGLSAKKIQEDVSAAENLRNVILVRGLKTKTAAKKFSLLFQTAI